MATDSAIRARAGAVGDETIHHDQELTGPGEIEARWQLVQVVPRAVGEHPDEAQRAKVLHHRRMGQPGHRGQRKRDQDTPAGHGGEDIVGRTLGRIAAHGGATDLAVAAAHAGPEEP